MLAAATADTTKLILDIPPGQIYAAILLGGIAFLVSIGAGIATIWNSFRRLPPTSESLLDFERRAAEAYATKHELASAVTAIREEIRSTRAARQEDLRDLRVMVEQGLSELRRSVGRIEGKLEHCSRCKE